jgi:inhibitor of cysteine peptidase
MIQSKLSLEFFISLDSNPTTGYRWDAKFDPERLKLIGKSFQPSGTGAIGSGGIERFSFVPIKPGETEVVMVYKRPWESAEIDKKIFPVSVSG